MPRGRPYLFSDLIGETPPRRGGRPGLRATEAAARPNRTAQGVGDAASAAVGSAFDTPSPALQEYQARERAQKSAMSQVEDQARRLRDDSGQGAGSIPDGYQNPGDTIERRGGGPAMPEVGLPEGRLPPGVPLGSTPAYPGGINPNAWAYRTPDGRIIQGTWESAGPPRPEDEPQSDNFDAAPTRRTPAPDLNDLVRAKRRRGGQFFTPAMAQMAERTARRG
jgi:hypothetical protein